MWELEGGQVWGSILILRREMRERTLKVNWFWKLPPMQGKLRGNLEFGGIRARKFVKGIHQWVVDPPTPFKKPSKKFHVIFKWWRQCNYLCLQILAKVASTMLRYLVHQTFIYRDNEASLVKSRLSDWTNITDPEPAVRSICKSWGTWPILALGTGAGWGCPNMSFQLSLLSGGNSYWNLPAVTWTSWSRESWKVLRPWMTILFDTSINKAMMNLQHACHRAWTHGP